MFLLLAPDSLWRCPFYRKGTRKNSSWEGEGINALCQLIGQWVTDSLNRGIDSRKEIDLWLLQLQFRPAFLEPTPWQEFSINTLIFQHSLFFTFPLTGPTHSLQCDFQKEYYHSLISANCSIPPQKCICHATILLLVTPFRWDFFQLQKQQKFRQTTERKKQTTWEKTRSSWYTLLRFYWKYWVNTHWTLLLFSSFFVVLVLVTHTHTQHTPRNT